MSANTHWRLRWGNVRPAGRCLLLALILMTLVGARTAQANILNVPSQYATIQAAIDAASDGDTVDVAPGTYTGTGNVDLTLNKNITVEGTGGASQTIINCQGSSSANHRGMSINGGTGTVRGFTIENGYSSIQGGGIFVANSETSPTITQCVFTNCDSPAGGGIEVNNGTGTIAATITQCVFMGCGDSGTLGGGIYVQQGAMVCTDCVFTRNSSSYGGGIFLWFDATVTLTNCSFTANSASHYGGGIYLQQYDSPDTSSATITNSLLYGNSASFGSDLFLDGAVRASLSHSDVGNSYNYGGTLNNDGTNGSFNPLFASATSPYDLHLQAGSPALGLGTSSAPNFPTTDLDGNAWASPPAAGAYQGNTANTSTALGLTSGSNPSAVAASLTFTATVTNTSDSVTPAGSVQFFVDGSSAPAATVTLNGSAQATYSTSSLTQGSHTISASFVANTRFNASNSTTLNQQVIGAPMANAQTVNVPFNTATPITLTGSDPNSPPLALTYSIATNPAHGTLSGFNASTGAVTYTPSAGYQGSDSFTFTVSNGTLTSSPATVTLNVGAGTPTANPQTVVVNHDTAKAITLTGSDPDSPPLSLTYSVVTNPTHGTLSGTPPNLTYTPNAGSYGTDSFTFTVNNGTNTSSPAAVTLNVGVGQPTPNSQTVNVPYNTATPITLTGTDPNTPPLLLTYMVISNPSHGTLGGFNASTGAVTYTPNTGYYGQDSFQFIVNNGTNSPNSGVVTLNVAAPGPPTANSQNVSTNESTPVGITLTGSDPNSLPLTYSYAQPAHGTVTGTGANVTYTPNAGYFGSDSFAFTVNNGASTSSPATASISVTQVATHLGVSMASSTTVGTSVPVTVTVLDAGNSVVSGYSGSGTLTSSDPRAVLPAGFSLTNGVATTSVTFNTAGSQSLNASASGLSGSANIAVSSAANGTPKLAIGGISLSRSGSNVIVQFTLTNSGNGEADNVHMTIAKLAGISASSLPSEGTLGAGQTTSVSLTFAGVASGSQTLQLTGAYTAASNGAAGSFTSTSKVTVP